jgi:hypothetical protein
MNNRVALLVCLDTAMLLLVCVLEPIKPLASARSQDSPGTVPLPVGVCR